LNILCERTHKIWYPTHLYNCFESNVDDPLVAPLWPKWLMSSYWWFKKEFGQLLVSMVFLTKGWLGNVFRWVRSAAVQVYGKKNIFAWGEAYKLNDSHLWERLLWHVWDALSLTLFRKVNVEHFIGENIHKPNVLRFWVKMWCPTHLYNYSESNVFFIVILNPMWQLLMIYLAVELWIIKIHSSKTWRLIKIKIKA
jgi:hypothetical protein